MPSCRKTLFLGIYGKFENDEFKTIATAMPENGFVIERTSREAVCYDGKIEDLKILRDGYIMEVFVNGGEEVFSVLL